jgi:hypothetical protein
MSEHPAPPVAQFADPGIDQAGSGIIGLGCALFHPVCGSTRKLASWNAAGSVLQGTAPWWESEPDAIGRESKIAGRPARDCAPIARTLRLRA